MAITLKKLWGHVQRPWGYEVRANFSDDTGKIYHDVFNFPKEPGEKEINQRVANSIARLEAEAAYSEMPIETPEEQTVKMELTAVIDKLTPIIMGCKDASSKAQLQALKDELTGKTTQSVGESR